MLSNTEFRSPRYLNNSNLLFFFHFRFGGGRMVRRCMVNFQCRGVVLIWIVVGQGPIPLALGAGGEFFCRLSISLFFLSRTA